MGLLAIANQDAFAYVWRIEPGSYCPAFQTVGGDGRSTSQLSESLWNAMREIRFLPLTQAYVDLLFLYSKWFSERYEDIKKHEAGGIVHPE